MKEQKPNLERLIKQGFTVVMSSNKHGTFEVWENDWVGIIYDPQRDKVIKEYEKRIVSYGMR